MSNPLKQFAIMFPFAFDIDKPSPALIHDINCMLNLYNDNVIGFYPFKEPGVNGYGIGLRGLFNDKDVSLITLWSDCLLRWETGMYELYFGGTDDTSYMLEFSSLQSIYDYVHVELPRLLKEDGYITKTSDMIEIN